MIKIIVFGSSGMLGNYISSYFSEYHDVIKIDRNIFDALNATIENLIELLEKYSLSNVQFYVINCIGIIPQRISLDETKKYIKINTLFPHQLAFCCNYLNYKMIHITTDCVFSGSKGNYNENDVHDETDIYGVTKSLGEPNNCCVIRTSIIGREKYNKKSLMEWIISQNNKNINGYDNHYWNGVTCLQLAKIIHFMINNNIYWNGVKHIFSPEIVSKYQLIEIIKEIYGLNINITKLETYKVNKTLASKYELFYNIPSLVNQIKDLKEFNLR